MKVLSFDAETNGLWGDAFAVSAAVYGDDKLTASFTAYLGAEGVTDDWVKENILPTLDGIAKTHDSYDALLLAFAEFYKAHKGGADIVTHVGVPVEAKKILFDIHARGYIGNEEMPHPLLDVASVLKANGYDPISVDAYNAKYALMDGREEVDGLAPHQPLYDSIAAAVAYMHLLK